MTYDKCGKNLLRILAIVLLIAIIATICQFRIVRTKVTAVDGDIIEFRCGTEYYGFYGDGFQKGDSVTVFMWKYFVIGAW